MLSVNFSKTKKNTEVPKVKKQWQCLSLPHSFRLSLPRSPLYNSLACQVQVSSSFPSPLPSSGLKGWFSIWSPWLFLLIQILIERLLYTKSYTRPWRYKDKWDSERGPHLRALDFGQVTYSLWPLFPYL